MPDRSPRPKAAVVNQFRPHPWHGLEVGPDPPDVVNAFIEITSFDLMKYEVDKVSGDLHVDPLHSSLGCSLRKSADMLRSYLGDPETAVGAKIKAMELSPKELTGGEIEACAWDDFTARTWDRRPNNGIVDEIRASHPWVPLPTFTFRVWLAGLVLGILLLLALTRVVSRGAPWIGAAAALPITAARAGEQEAHHGA